MPLTLHLDDPDFLYQAIGYTAQATGFDPRLIEKDHAVQNGQFNPLDIAFLDLLGKKLVAPRTGPVNVAAARVVELQAQLQGQLRPMLREQDYSQFDLTRAVTTVRAIASALQSR